MAHAKHEDDSPVERKRRRIHVFFTRKMQERQIFMEELSAARKRRYKRLIQEIRESIGPNWYQVLSVIQRQALDRLEASIYQDLLEGRPVRTEKVMKILGLFPSPSHAILMHCNFRGRNDPKEMLSALYQLIYDQYIEVKKDHYSLNARLILSAIFYLGLHNLIDLLREKFRPDEEEPPPPPPRPKPLPRPKSPYLQVMTAPTWSPAPPQRKLPPPLPNLETLNEPFEEETFTPKPPLPPPPPPPPAPRKKLPISYCDKMAGIIRIEPKNDAAAPKLPPPAVKKNKAKLYVETNEKKQKRYGLNLGGMKTTRRRRKPVAPNSGAANSQYHILGVYTVRGRSVYVLGSICILPPEGDYIHGGHKYTELGNINIHCGYRGRPPAVNQIPCDCVKKWNDAVFDYVKCTKCYCGHFYDYGNEGTYPPESIQYFEKPSRNTTLPYQLNYNHIYEVNPKKLHISNEFKKLWDTESVLLGDDPEAKEKKERLLKKKKPVKKSNTCLSGHPKPEDYLRCALRFMRQVNIAARLPDVHLVPELKEWMRRRIFGPLTEHQKKVLAFKSYEAWQMFRILGAANFGHVNVPKDCQYTTETNWSHKQRLNVNFKKYANQYRLAIFRSQANIINMFWPSMCQAQLPDKKFREIYFSYVADTAGNLHLQRPYSRIETAELVARMLKKRYRCPLKLKEIDD